MDDDLFLKIYGRQVVGCGTTRWTIIYSYFRYCRRGDRIF